METYFVLIIIIIQAVAIVLLLREIRHILIDAKNHRMLQGEYIDMLLKELSDRGSHE